jgi:hypothetical protein
MRNVSTFKTETEKPEPMRFSEPEFAEPVWAI